MSQTTPMPTTPTTKILAIGTFPPGTDMQLVQHILPTEVRETAQFYLEGKIDQWYSPCHGEADDPAMREPSKTHCMGPPPDPRA